MSEVREFLHRVHGRKPPDKHVDIWELPQKKSVFFRDLDEAAAYAELLAQHHDVYYGVGLSDRDYGANNRILSAQVSGIPGLWADIDVAGPAHKDSKKVYAPTKDDVYALLNELPVKANVIVDSGGGVHAYWLFADPWLFGRESERVEAGTLEGRWLATIRTKARQHGWDIDGVGDLARVLRVAGTLNHKTTPAAPTSIVEMLDLDFSRYDFDKFLVEDWQPSPGLALPDGGRLVLSPDAEPPFSKFEALRENDRKFKATWDGKRKDLEDSSPSGYDMAIASLTARADWTDQEIANTIIARRRKHGDDLKLREDYYLRTISKARRERDASASVASADSRLEELKAKEQTGEDVERSDKIAVYNDRFGHGLEEARWYIPTKNGKPVGKGHFEFKFEAGTITGDVTLLVSQLKWRAQVLEQLKLPFPKLGDAAWQQWAVLLRGIAVTVLTGDSSSEAGAMAEVLRTYLDHGGGYSEFDTTNLGAFDQDGHVYFRGESFRHWLTLNSERMDARTMGRLVREIGCEDMQLRVELLGGKNKSVWRVPTTITDGTRWESK